MDKLPVTAIVHTRNSAPTLKRCLESLQWAREILVVDMASVDTTVEIAEQLATRVLPVEVAPRVDGIRNRFVDMAAEDWVLVLDSDEWLAADACEAVQALIDESGMQYDAIAIPRFNYVGEQLLRGGLWYPDNQVRLFRKGEVLWRDSHHEAPQVPGGRLLELSPPDCLHIHHQNYHNLGEVMERQLRYALTDSEAGNTADFSFADYVAQAHRCLAERTDPERDGDLSNALALILAWDSLMRGLLHWDRLEPRPALDFQAMLPPAERDIAAWRIKLKKWTGTRYPLLFHLRRVRRRLRGLLHRLPLLTGPEK